MSSSEEDSDIEDETEVVKAKSDESDKAKDAEKSSAVNPDTAEPSGDSPAS